MDALFELAQKYRPQEVGIEITGQQGGFIQWIQNEQMNRNIYFTLASGRGKTTPGIRPNKDKMSRFQQIALPLFKSGKIWFPEELQESPELAEMLVEIRLATFKGFKSKHDDQIDNISMLGEFNAWKPSEVSSGESGDGSMIWDDEEPEPRGSSSYFV